jgi:cytochrome P450
MSDWNPTSFNPHDKDFLADPYPVYAKFRANAPVSMVQPYGSYWVFGYDDVKTVLSDQAQFVKNSPTPTPPPGPFDALANFPAGLFNADPKPHTVMRETMEPLFHKSIGDAGDFAESTARALLSSNRRGRHFELYNDFAVPLPAKVLFHVLGLPEGHWDGVQRWVDGYVAGHDITQTPAIMWYSATSAMALMTYFQAMMDGKPVCPVGGQMLDLMVTERGTSGMTDGQVQASLQNLAIAGYASTTYLITTGTYRLLTNPTQFELLKSDPQKLLSGAIAEMLRIDAPAQLVDRVAANDCELGGVQLRRGDKVTAVLGSANHDSSVFENPDALDITRDSSKQLAFGYGIHECLGEPLVWLSAPAAFRAMLDTYPDMTLAGIPQWQTDPYLRSVINLPVAVEA